jgi:hypothetical protein
MERILIEPIKMAKGFMALGLPKGCVSEKTMAYLDANSREYNDTDEERGEHLYCLGEADVVDEHYDEEVEHEIDRIEITLEHYKAHLFFFTEED